MLGELPVLGAAGTLVFGCSVARFSIFLHGHGAGRASCTVEAAALLMADQTPSPDPIDDPLAFFEPEPGSAMPPPAPPRAAAPMPVPAPSPRKIDAPPPAAVPQAPPDELAFLRTPLPHERKPAADASPLEAIRPAPIDFDVEVLGPPPPEGSVSFDHVCSVKGLGFVEGVALIQAASAAVNAAGPNAGVPELHGLYLTSTGEVILHGPPTGEPPARELARLLHQLVAPNLMPPAGRLFVGRWINNDLGDLTEFSSELSYFARPNGQELLVGLHGRCNGIAPKPVAEARRRQERARQQAKAAAPVPEPQSFSTLVRQWLRDHKPEVTAAIAIIASATLAALGTWIWQASTVAAAKAPVEATQPADEAEETVPPGDDVLTVASGTTATLPGPPARRPAAPSSTSRGRTAPAQTSGQRGGSSEPPPVVTPPAPPQVAAAEPPPSPAAVPLPSSTIPDMRIYSTSDAGVDPPILRSPEILEVLIKGFVTRENVIELVISEKGEVQQARMVEAPQRIPDVMLLSRAKELHFDPAMRNGVPVRYRLRLTWKVTP